jgi:hypothetical protein
MSAPQSRAARITAVVAASAFLLATLMLELMAWLAAGFNCNESCSEDSGQWRDRSDSWQWDFQLGWATVGVGLAMAALTFAVTDRPRRAGYCFAAAVVLYAGWWVFVTG